MDKQVFYDSPIFGPLTKEEYQQFFCKLPQSSSDPVVTYHGFDYNPHGICLNPHKERFGDKDYYVELRTAMNKAGRWVCSVSWSMNGGGWSSGVWCGDKSFETEDEAKYSLLTSVEAGLRRKIKAIEEAEEYEEDYEFDYGEQRKQENRAKKCSNLLKKVLYYQEVYNNQTLF